VLGLSPNPADCLPALYGVQSAGLYHYNECTRLQDCLLTVHKSPSTRLGTDTFFLHAQVMEHLAYSLRSRSVVKRVDLCAVLCDIARALTTLHANGHVHRDVKARNVLVTKGYNKAKLCDFGLARALPSPARPDVRGDLTPRIGPPKYRAPEVRDGEWYDTSSDMYGFGVMCNQLVLQIREERQREEEKRREEEDRDGERDDKHRNRDAKKQKSAKHDGRGSKNNQVSENDLVFVEHLGTACVSLTPQKRPSAAVCLAKLSARLGQNLTLCSAETAAGRTRVWIPRAMDRGTGGKGAGKHERNASGTGSDDDDVRDDAGNEARQDETLEDVSVEQRAQTTKTRTERGEKREAVAKENSESASVGVGALRDKRAADTARGAKRRRVAERVGSGVDVAK
jgi:serine/threonine protein kinase